MVVCGLVNGSGDDYMGSLWERETYYIGEHLPYWLHSLPIGNMGNRRYASVADSTHSPISIYRK